MNHNCWRYLDEICCNPTYCGLLGQCGYIKESEYYIVKELNIKQKYDEMDHILTYGE